MELLTDIDKVLFYESGIRGGFSQISTRYAKANNKYMNNYDKTTEDSYIIYLDANNLYGYSMIQYLPYAGFEWNEDKWNSKKIASLKDDADIGYTFSVDLSIPTDKHDYFNNYVPLPITQTIDKKDLNKWQQVNYKNSKVTKLVASFKDRKNYIVNYRLLKLALSLGFKLDKVNKVMQYKQKPFMRPYIEMNTQLRKQAGSDDFKKDFFKLMNNSVFGKSFEDVRSRINFKLISDERKVDNIKNLKTFRIFDDGLVGVHLHKTKIKLDKPIYLGQTILDDSKVLMLDFHYNFILKKVDRNNMDLLMTDTDSLMYHIKKQDIFQIIKEDMENGKDSKFDLSNYPENHELYNNINKKVVAKFKIESIDQIIEFVGLRAKLYSYKTDSKESKICKGVKKSVVQKILTLENYKEVLFNHNKISVNQRRIRSYIHQLYSEQCSKVALSGNDDKLYICDDNIKTYNFGHKNILK